MPDYKGSTLTAARRMRAHTIVARNPPSGVPGMEFHEEFLTELSDGRLLQEPQGVLRKDFSAPLTQFNLLNPLDGSVIGTATFQDVYVMLYSLYLHVATERDNAPPPEP